VGVKVRREVWSWKAPKHSYSVKKSARTNVPASSATIENRRHSNSRLRAALAILGLLSATSGQLVCQEAVRTSLAGEAAAEARHRAAAVPGFYDLQLGPTKWNLAAGLDLEANDNIRFASSQPDADLTVRPQVNTQMDWRVSEQNTLNLALGAGYSAYVFHSQFDRFFVGPGSELSFDLYAGDFWINLHERFSITENAYSDPTVVGTADYSQLQNSAGVLATWDLNQLILRLGYDHANYNTVSGGGGVPNGVSEVANCSAGYRFGPELTTGLESGGGLIQYSGAAAGITEAVDWNLGAFLQAQPMEHVSVKAGAGYTAYIPQAADNLSKNEFTGAYARIALNHQLNQWVEYGLSGGRNISFGFFGGTIDLYSAALSARWRLFSKLGLVTWFEFEHGSQVLVGQESFDRFGPGMSLDRPITRKMTGSIRYQYYQRGSDMPGGDYLVNIVTLSLLVSL